MERKRHSTLVKKDCTATIALLPLSQTGTASASQGTAGTSEGKDMEADKTQLTSPPSPLEILRLGKTQRSSN